MLQNTSGKSPGSTPACPSCVSTRCTLRRWRERPHEKEVDEVIRWLTGYTQKRTRGISAERRRILKPFEQAPKAQFRAKADHGRHLRVRIENIEDPLIREVRYLDKLIDELAKGKSDGGFYEKMRGSYQL